MARPCSLCFLVKHLSSVGELARARARQQLNMVSSNLASNACAITEEHLWSFNLLMMINSGMINKTI